MSRVPDIKRIRVEDFPEDQQELVGKLAYALNTFMDQTINVLNGNVDMINLAQEIKDITVKTDGGGAVLNTPIQVQTGINRKVTGILCIKADNLGNILTYPTGNPWVSWTIDGSIIKIQNITDLTASSDWRLRLLIIGENS